MLLDMGTTRGYTKSFTQFYQTFSNLLSVNMSIFRVTTQLFSSYFIFMIDTLLTMEALLLCDIYVDLHVHVGIQ